MGGLGRWCPSPGGLVTTLALLVALVASFTTPPAARYERPAELAELAVPVALAEALAVAEPAPPVQAAPPAPAPTLLRIGLGPGEEPARRAIGEWVEVLWSGYSASFSAPLGERFDVVVSHRFPGPGMEALLLGTTRWAAAGHFMSDLDDISLEDLRAAFRGEKRSWAELGGPDVGIAPVLIAPSRAVGAAALGLTVDELGEVDWTAEDDFPDRAGALARARGVLLVAPLRLADPRFRPLLVSGMSPLLQRGSETEYPLQTERWLGFRRDQLAGAEGERFVRGLARLLADDLARPEPEVVTLTAVGDIIFGRKVDEKLAGYDDWTRPFHLVGEELRRADLTVANLECTLTDKHRPPRDWTTMAFGSSLKAIEGLKYAGIDVVNLGNNHSRDMGIDPFSEMLDALWDEEIAYVGAGLDRAEAHAPFVIEVKGTRFAFLGYDDVSSRYYGATGTVPGTAVASEEAVRRDVAAARELADVVVPFFHWGHEYTNRPSERQRRLAHAAIDAGATLVLGSHAHWVQAVEFYKDGFIAYGLGNFIFDQSWSAETTQGVIMQTSFLGNRLAGVRFLPIQIEDLHQPRIVDRAAGKPILERMFSASAL